MHARVRACVRALACVKNPGERERGKILVLEKGKGTGRSLLCLLHLCKVKVLTVAVGRSLGGLSVVGEGQDRVLLLNSLPFKLKCGSREGQERQFSRRERVGGSGADSSLLRPHHYTPLP